MATVAVVSLLTLDSNSNGRNLESRDKIQQSRKSLLVMCVWSKQNQQRGCKVCGV